MMVHIIVKILSLQEQSATVGWMVCLPGESQVRLQHFITTTIFIPAL